MEGKKERNGQRERKSYEKKTWMFLGSAKDSGPSIFHINSQFHSWSLWSCVPSFWFPC
jgi:hypothetical protein